MNRQRSCVNSLAGKQKTSPDGLVILYGGGGGTRRYAPPKSRGHIDKRPALTDWSFCMAVAVGFEPTESFHPHTLSRRAP